MKYLIFGGTGSLGKKLIESMISEHDVSVYSRDEAKHWTIKNEYENHSCKDKLKFFVGDIRDTNRIKDVIQQVRPTHIIIAAALKQVDTCELSPSESILTNLTGTINVVNAIRELQPDYLTACLFVSTDKACSPVNVYGMCKATSERVITSQSLTGLSWVKYLAVRYGNVLESRGSIIPLFRYQSEHSKILTVTDPEMTRYVMTLDDSVKLIKTAFELGVSGETWIPQLSSMKIGHLAEIFAEKYNKKIEIIGHRPGEKQHEDLINESESVRTRIHSSSKHYVIGSATSPPTGKVFTYASNQNVMSKNDLQIYLTNLGILAKNLEDFKGLSIEEIRK